jgi:hypothetical protein
MPEFDLDEMNHSELVKMCHWIGMKNVTRGVPRDVIIQSLTSTDTITVPNPVDKERKDLSDWMKRHWSVIEMQVPKSECPNCFLCEDAQVIECFEENKRHFKP